MPQPRFIWPVTCVAGAAADITQTPNTFRFDEGAGELTATIPAGEYFIRGGGAAATDLVQTLATQMTAVGGQAYTVSLNNGRVTISAAGNFTLRWLTGTAPRFDGTVLGFSTAANDTGANAYTSDYQHRFGWYPERDLIDGRRRFETATAGGARSTGGQQYIQQWARDWRATCRVDFVVRTKVYNIEVDGTSLGETYEPLTAGPSTTWEGLYDWMRRGGRAEFYPDVNAIAYATVVADPGTGEWLRDIEACAELQMARGERYKITIPLRPYVA